MEKRIGKIRDVARETGLSIATISRVMNGSAKVTEETRHRVEAACKKLNYFPNAAARSLSTNKTKTIATIIPNIEHSIYAKFISAIEQTLSERQYSLVLAISNGDEEIEFKEARKLLGMGSEAFILSGARHSPELYDLLEGRNIPYVFTSVWDPALPTPMIGYDNSGLARAALTYLKSKGHSEIAVVHGPVDSSDRISARVAGARQACGKTMNVTFFETSLDASGGKHAVQALLERATNVTAILCLSDVLALGVYFGLAAAGLSVPDDMSVMGFDNLDWSTEIVPPLTTTNLPARKMGRSVALQLMDLLDINKDLEPTLLEGQIIERGSVLSV
ncbi:MAG: LacI family DNA-binding transcriptional regulator [Roseibium sp.]|uniref:LacI family DNA-binding transcriptional regulator n=1 Tax=Roseibium sp. TaxID=1936156 RepID=UPI003D9C63A0